MRRAHLYITCLLCLAGNYCQCFPEEPKLDKSDQEFLENLIKWGLWDPMAPEGDKKPLDRVRVKAIARTCWGTVESCVAAGWLLPAKGNKPAMVLLDNLGIVPNPEVTETVSLAKEYAPFLIQKAKEPDDDDIHSREAFAQMNRTRIGVLSDLQMGVLWSAWLLKLGKTQEATKIWSLMKNEHGEELENFKKSFRETMAWRAFSEAANAFILRADAEALLQAERLTTVFPDVEAYIAQSKALLTDLKRRKISGHFFEKPPAPMEGKKEDEGPDNGQKAFEWPKESAGWPIEMKVKFLIDALEEVDARQWGQPGGIDLASDPRIKELIEIGDAAIPALIDCIETDSRLMRSMHFWRDFSRHRTILSVREGALNAAMSILRTRFFEARATGDNFTANGEEAAKQTANTIRQYWAEYGKLSFPERMMKTLQDGNANSEAWREAAENLVYPLVNETKSSMVFSDRVEEEEPKGPNPNIAKFHDPSVAEAILVAMDRELAQIDAKKEDDLYEYHRWGAEGFWIQCLIDLDDRGIAPKLTERCEAAMKSNEVRLRRLWAFALSSLGSPKLFEVYCDEVQLGKIPMLTFTEPNTNDNDQPGTRELKDLLSCLVTTNSPKSLDTLGKITSKGHLYFEQIREHVLQARGFEDSIWVSNPFCISILASELENTDWTGTTCEIQGDHYKETTDRGSWTSDTIPEYLKGVELRPGTVTLRRCDQAARKVSEMVVGCRPYNPLFKDSEARLTEMRDYLAKYRGKFRALNGLERSALGIRWSENPRFAPIPAHLNAGASAEDVAGGNAVFHLAPRGTPFTFDVHPAVIHKNGNPYLILQAEKDKDGVVHYGLLGAIEIIHATEDQITKSCTLEEATKVVSKGDE